MAAKVGKDCDVKLGSTTVVGMGTWTMSGVSTDMIEKTAFLDEWKQYVMGLKDGGTISFNGYYDPADSTGQTALRTYNGNNTELTSIRLYVDASSYWTPKTTNPYSYVLITGWSVSADKSGLMQATFEAKISGQMELI